VAVLNPVPKMATTVPAGPLVGVKDVIVGKTAITKFVALNEVPAAFVTLIGPVVVPAPTVAVIFVFELTVKVEAGVPLNATAVVPVNALPVMVTTVPAMPTVGVKEVITGPPASTVKFDELERLPAAFVTLISPVVAPAGTVALI
jgi:hypothetical protein